VQDAVFADNSGLQPHVKALEHLHLCHQLLVVSEHVFGLKVEEAAMVDQIESVEHVGAEPRVVLH